jgi:hypothetical protein
MNSRPLHLSRRAALLALVAASVTAQAQQLASGQVKGSAVEHTAASARAVIDDAYLVLPASATGGATYAGPWRAAPTTAARRVPVVVFLHGSSGLGLKAIAEWQLWLASLGIASVAPDSFALPDRVTYASPVGKDVYEKIHALRASEIALALRAIQQAPWADASRAVLAGTSEGATAVARHSGDGFAGRIVFSWSCEDNYFVDAHRTAARADQPVLNIISASDPFFSPANSWLGNPAARGHCAAAWKDAKQASVVLIPGAPHTLINLPRAREATAGFLQAVLNP